MAVLVEGISVLIRLDSVQEKMDGGDARLKLLIPNATFCSDGELARVGFMDPAAVGLFIDELKECGLTFIEDRKAIDIVVCDQQSGPTTDCDWLEFGHLPIDGGKVGAGWLFEGERMGHGLHFKGLEISFAAPNGWKFKGSMSDKFHFVPNDTSKH